MILKHRSLGFLGILLCAASSCQPAGTDKNPLPSMGQAGMVLPACMPGQLLWADASRSGVCITAQKTPNLPDCATGQVLNSKGMDVYTCGAQGGSPVDQRILAAKQAVDQLGTVLSAFSQSGEVPAATRQQWTFVPAAQVSDCPSGQSLAATVGGAVTCQPSSASVPFLSQIPDCTPENLLSNTIGLPNCVLANSVFISSTSSTTLMDTSNQWNRHQVTLRMLETATFGNDQTPADKYRPPACAETDLLSISSGALTCVSQTPFVHSPICNPHTGGVQVRSEKMGKYLGCGERDNYAGNAAALLTSIEAGVNEAYRRLITMQCWSKGC